MWVAAHACIWDGPSSYYMYSIIPYEQFSSQPTGIYEFQRPAYYGQIARYWADYMGRKEADPYGYAAYGDTVRMQARSLGDQEMLTYTSWLNKYLDVSREVTQESWNYNKTSQAARTRKLTQVRAAAAAYKGKRLRQQYALLVMRCNMLLGASQRNITYWTTVGQKMPAGMWREAMRNIYANANPTVPKEMGDVGNDAGIYGSRLYCVINCSNKVEVMDRDNCRRIGQINIPNCRFIKFYGGYAYVTSYAGPVVIDPNYKQRGYVAKVDTATLEVVDTCVVGFQPDQLDIAGGKIYVANSGGYMVPNYENTLSVIDLATFKEEARIPIAINLLGVVADRRGVLWVTSRGDYYSNPSDIYAYDTRKGRIVKRMDCRASSCWMDGDSLYVVSSDWSYVTGGNAKPRYQIINTLTMQVVDTCFIKDGTDGKIEKPYGVAVNPITKDIMVADAKDYVSPGRLYCFGPNGQMKWNVRTGDIPAHFVFLGRNENEH